MMGNFKKVVTGVIGASLLSSAVCAAELNISCKPDDYLTFEGADFLSDSVIVTVVPDGAEYNENTEYAVIREANPKKGNFKFSVKMPPNAKSGYYVASVFDGDSDEIREKFYFCNPLPANDVLSSMNVKNVTYSELASNAAVLGIENDIAQNISDTGLFIDLFNRFSNGNSFTAESFSGAYIGALLFSNNNLTFDDFLSTLQNNAKILGIENHAFGDYSEERQKKIFENISKCKISSNSFGNALCEVAFLTALGDAKTKDSYKKVIFEEFESLLSLNTADYNSLRSPYDVIVLLMEKTYYSSDDFKSDFNQTVSNRIYAENSSSQGSSGGGGFGGGSSGASYGSDVVDSPIPITQPQNSAVEFDDIKNHWAKTPVMYLKSKNVIDGVGDNLFDPEKKVTRAEFAKMIARAFAIDKADDNITFADVTESDWFASDVYALASAGVINGTGDGIFAPYMAISRQDAAVIMLRTANHAKISLNGKRGGASFNDASAIAPYASDAVDTLYKAQLISGVSPESFSPEAAVTRAQAAQMIYNLLIEKGGSL